MSLTAERVDRVKQFGNGRDDTRSFKDGTFEDGECLEELQVGNGLFDGGEERRALDRGKTVDVKESKFSSTVTESTLTSTAGGSKTIVGVEQAEGSTTFTKRTGTETTDVDGKLADGETIAPDLVISDAKDILDVNKATYVGEHISPHDSEKIIDLLLVEDRKVGNRALEHSDVGKVKTSDVSVNEATSETTLNNRLDLRQSGIRQGDNVSNGTLKAEDTLKAKTSDGALNAIEKLALDGSNVADSGKDSSESVDVSNRLDRLDEADSVEDLQARDEGRNVSDALDRLEESNGARDRNDRLEDRLDTSNVEDASDGVEAILAGVSDKLSRARDLGDLVLTTVNRRDKRGDALNVSKSSDEGDRRVKTLECLNKGHSVRDGRDRSENSVDLGNLVDGLDDLKIGEDRQGITLENRVHVKVLKESGKTG